MKCFKALVAVVLSCATSVAAEESREFLIPPLTDEQMDLVIDSLRSQRPLEFPPFHVSGKIDPLVEGIWAGSKTETQSSVGPITLRFRRRLSSLVSADSRREVSANDLLESFDISLEQDKRNLIVRHSNASNLREQAGISLLVSRPSLGTQAAVLRGVRESGVFLGIPPLADVNTAWAALVCPRTFGRERRGRTGLAVFDLTPSPYELSEVKVSFASQGSVSMSTAGRLGRARIGIRVSDALPKPEQGDDEGISAAPRARYTYHPSIPFDFFRFAPYTSVQQGVSLQVLMQNRKGWMRTENLSNAVYVQKVNEAAPVTPVVSGRGVERNEGECYLVLRYNHSWREYAQESDPEWAKGQDG